uniref:Uncharacterized protein n=1 Tax=Megaselia scalaris TaxID=36166 RepID=T1GTS4_MEGSC
MIMKSARKKTNYRVSQVSTQETLPTQMATNYDRCPFVTRIATNILVRQETLSWSHHTNGAQISPGPSLHTNGAQISPGPTPLVAALQGWLLSVNYSERDRA